MSKQEFISELNQLFSNKVGNEKYKVVDGMYEPYKCDIYIVGEFNCNILYKKSIGQDAGWDRCHKCKLHSGCNVCKEFLDLVEKYGYSFDWISCCVAGLWKKNETQIKNERVNKRLTDKEYYEKNKEEILAKRKEYREKNREKINEYKKEYHEKNKEKINEYKKEYREKNKEKINEYREKNREEILAKRKEYREKNREEISAKKKIYNKEYREKIRRKLI